MSNSDIIACLEQKVILLTKVLNLTKQIQVRSNQEDIVLDDFLEQRGIYMERVKKCNELISCIAKQMPPEQEERVTRLLHSDINEEDCSEEELLILTLSKKSNTLLKKTDSLNKLAYEAIEKQYKIVMDKLAELRKAGKTPNMFQNQKTF